MTITDIKDHSGCHVENFRGREWEKGNWLGGYCSGPGKSKAVKSEKWLESGCIF